MRRGMPAVLLVAVVAMVALVLVLQRASNMPSPQQRSVHQNAGTTPASVHPVASVSANIGPLFDVLVQGHRVYVQGRPADSGNIAGFSTSGGSLSLVCGPGPKPTLCPAVDGLGEFGRSYLKVGGRIFVPDAGHERVRAFPAGCRLATIGQGAGADHNACQPLWTTAGISSYRFGLAASSDTLFVFQDHGGCCGNTPGPHGGILAYPIDCGTGNATCEPTWTWGTGSNGGPRASIQAVAVSGDRLYAASGDGRLYVFALGGTG